MESTLQYKFNNNNHNILIVEDCKFFSDAVKTVLNLIPQKKPSLKFNIEQALDYKTAMTKIKEAKGSYDIVILDIRLRELIAGAIKSGEKLGAFLRDYFPKTKIVVITSYSDGFRINSIIKNVNPEGFLIKNKASDPKLFQKVIMEIIKGKTYHCNTVSAILRKKNKISYKLDDIDRKLLYQLSIATKKKDMPNYLSLKMSGIEKRHRHLKEIFDVDNDRDLLLKAKENGFL